MGPRFSVVFPVESEASGLSRSLVSVLAQTFGDLEVLVVPLGVGEDALAPVNLLGDERVVILDGLDSANGVSEAVNECRGVQVAIIDSGTTVRANWLAQCGRGLDRTGRRALVCGGTEYRADGTEVHLPASTQAARPGNFLLPRRAMAEIAEAATDQAPAGTTAAAAGDLARAASRSSALNDAAALEHDLVDWAPAGAGDSDGPTPGAEPTERQRLDWIQQGLEVLAASPIPDLGLLARYATEGGMAAVRLNMVDEARRMFTLARSAQPGELMPALRWAATLVPGVATFCWPHSSEATRT